MTEVDATVRSELLFREVNERIFEVSGDMGADIEVLCECGDESCISTLMITVRDYQQVRQELSRFVVCAGHELADIERVVERTPNYLIVEKVGRARQVAERWTADRIPPVSSVG